MDPKLCEAAMNGDLNYFKDIIESQEPLDLLSQITPKSNHTILHIAVEFNQTAFVKSITQTCPSLLWLRNSAGDTALHVAARSEALQDILQFLINFAKSQTIDIETGQSGRHKELLRMVNLDKDTALHCAARLGIERCVELLVEADPELCCFVNNVNESPLYLAAASGKSRTLQFIINVASPSTPYKGPNGLTALHVAQLVSKFGYKENEMLVNWRRQMITETDDSGSTPLHYASLYGRTEAVELFLEFDSYAIYLLNTKHEDSALHLAAFFGHVDTLFELLNSHPDSCYLINNKGRTVLHAAVLGNQRYVVKYILKTPRLAMLINKPDEDGNTPMHLAALFMLFDMIEILSKYTSVNLRIKNKEGFIALDVYGKRVEEGREKDMPWKFLKGYSQLRGGKKMNIPRHLNSAQEKLKMMEEEAVIKNQTEQAVENIISDKLRSSAEGNKLIGILVATVSFAAAFTMPGGYINDGPDKGLETFTHKPAFQAFIVSNAIAFCLSISGVLFHYRSSTADVQHRYKYLSRASGLIICSLYAMFATFWSGNYVVLTKSKPLSIAPMVILGFVFIIYVLSFYQVNRYPSKLFAKCKRKLHTT